MVHPARTGTRWCHLPHVLDRLANALMLTESERKHLFLLGRGRPPADAYCRRRDSLTPRLQRLLDALPYSPAIVKNATWDVPAWNRATAMVLIDYGKLPPNQRNVLRMIFCDPHARSMQTDWENVAQTVVAAFRLDAARAGAEKEVLPLVNELCTRSPEFAAIWRENIVQSPGTVKCLHHPVLGPIMLEYSSLAIDGRTDLAIVVYNPATARDYHALQSYLETG